MVSKKDINDTTQELITDLENIKTKMKAQMDEISDHAVKAEIVNHNYDSHANHANNPVNTLPANYQRSIFTSYSDSAKYEIKNMWLLRFFLIGFILFSIYLSYYFFIPIFKGDETLTLIKLIINFIPFAFVLALITYLVMIEKKQQKIANADKELGLKLTLLDNYLREIPKEDSDIIKVELSRHLFNSINSRK